MKVLVSLLQVLENGKVAYSHQENDADYIVCPFMERAAQLFLCDCNGRLDYDAIRELGNAGYRVEYGDEGVHCICTKVGFITFEGM